MEFEVCQHVFVVYTLTWNIIMAVNFIVERKHPDKTMDLL